MTTTLNTPRKPRMITNVTQYDEFDLGRLLANVFVPIEGSKVAFLIDLDDPTWITDFAFLQDPAWPIQHRAHEHFYQAFHAGVGERLGLSGGDLYAYKTTGGSNLDLPDQAFTPEGNEVSLEADVYPADPFASLDARGVGRLMRIAVEDGLKSNAGLKLGICGEHGGDPASIAICQDLGLAYVSCSPYRVPIARLAAAQAALRATWAAVRAA